MATPPIFLLDHHLPFLSVHEHQKESAYSKEDAIHYAKSEGCLEHGTFLVKR